VGAARLSSQCSRRRHDASAYWDRWRAQCWRPTFARSLVPKFTALRRDLERVCGTSTSSGRRSAYAKGRVPGRGVVDGSRNVRPR
jgi:hypothetical protein